MNKVLATVLAILVCATASAALMEIIDKDTGVVRPAVSNDFGGASAGGSGGVASLGVGIAAESTTQIATGVTTALSSIASGVTPPMWITLRNVGLTTIHYSNGTPTDSSDGIAAGEQAAMFVSTNTPVLNMRAHSTGVSTLTVNIWK